MTPNNAYLGKATLTVSGLVAIAIVVAALVLPDAAVKPVQAAKTENGASWTLDRRTGVITMCKVRDEHMVCAGSANATQMPSSTADQLENKRLDHRQERQTERKEAFNQFFTFFERISVSEKLPTLPSSGGQVRRPRNVNLGRTTLVFFDLNKCRCRCRRLSDF
jgi:glucose dehydrogenase